MKIVLSCSYAPRGCAFQLEKHQYLEMSVHEQGCLHRTVHCLSKHRGSCQWTGSIGDLVGHSRIMNCFQILRMRRPHFREPFRSCVSDYSYPNSSVFRKSVAIHWKPVFFASNELTPYLLYLTIRRSATGLWTFVTRTFSPQPIRRRIKVDLCVHSSRLKDSSTHRFSYRGEVVQSYLANTEIMEARKLLVITDEQVKMMREPGQLFFYSVDFEISPNLPIWEAPPVRPQPLRGEDANGDHPGNIGPLRRPRQGDNNAA